MQMLEMIWPHIQDFADESIANDGSNKEDSGSDDGVKDT